MGNFTAECDEGRGQGGLQHPGSEESSLYPDYELDLGTEDDLGIGQNNDIITSVDTNPEGGDVSVSVVTTCENILGALQRDNFTELYQMIRDVLPNDETDKLPGIFTDSDAEVTVFVPPRDATAGVLHSYYRGPNG